MPYTQVIDDEDDNLAAYHNELATGLDAAEVELDNLNTGWIAAVGTWTYASPNTITIPTNGATTYGKGMRIRFKQGGGYKYYACAAIAATTLTTFVNTDHVVTNDPITDVYYSFAASPYGYPDLFTRTATGIVSGSGGSAGTYAQSVATAMYRVLGTTVTEYISLVVTNVGSWSGDVIISTAVASAASEVGFLFGGVWASSAIPSANKGLVTVGGASNSIKFVATVGSAFLQWSGMAANDTVLVRDSYRF